MLNQLINYLVNYVLGWLSVEVKGSYPYATKNMREKKVYIELLK